MVAHLRFGALRAHFTLYTPGWPSVGDVVFPDFQAYILWDPTFRVDR